MFVSGAGNTNVDLIFSGLPRLPGEGEELYAQGFTLQMGGGVPATLINLGRLGVPTRIQTMLGRDMFSDFARRMFSQNHVQPVNLYQGDKIPLNVTAAMLTPGDRTFVSFSDCIPVTDEMRQTVYEASRGARVAEMHVGYLDVYRELKKDGTILVFDTGWEDDLSLEKYRDYLELADYYTPNQKEALKITGTATPSAAAAVLADYFDRVIIKLDKDGCLIRENGKTARIPNIPEYVHQDSTGAGDAFLAGLLYGLYYGYNFEESILFGNITGGKCITGTGCLAAFCTEAELLETAEKYRSLLHA
ncbi:MAG: carbohydrate kinase family protein [Butyricicoccus sp.]